MDGVVGCHRAQGTFLLLFVRQCPIDFSSLYTFFMHFYLALSLMMRRQRCRFRGSNCGFVDNEGVNGLVRFYWAPLPLAVNGCEIAMLLPNSSNNHVGTVFALSFCRWRDPVLWVVENGTRDRALSSSRLCESRMVYL
jgi:hypothetical protein